GLSRGEQGRAAAGLHWLARGLAEAPDDAVDLRRALRGNLAAWRPEVHPLRGCWNHPQVVQVVAFRPDGRVFLVGGQGRVFKDPGMARLYDSATGEPVGAPMEQRGGIIAAAFSPDGKAVLIGSGDFSGAETVGEARL